MDRPSQPPSKPVLTVVEELLGQELIYEPNLIYTTEFWRPFIPFKNILHFEKTGDREFLFEIEEEVKLEPTGLMTTHYHANGTIEVQDYGEQATKGNLWELQINVQDPPAKVLTRVRARPTKNALKVGIFIQSLEFDAGLLDTIPGGRDAILFAIRVYVRQLLQNIALSN
ncbi:MAG: hypothetical protein ACTSWW_13305 [Promethearchaeota archaeon]